MTTISEKIQDAFIGAEYLGAQRMEEELIKLVGLQMHNFNTVIADGADDDETEDQYIMCDGFSDDENRIVVHIYYGDVTNEINYVDVSEPAV